MKHVSGDFQINTRGETDIIDITDEISEFSGKSGIKNGVVTVFVKGSTAGVTSVEYEPGLIKDLKEMFEKIAPRRGSYHHELAWHDGNGYAHVRASFLGFSQTVPIRKGRIILGTWQQIILVDFDNKPRTRTVFLDVIGD